jgi:acetyltransferase-like isoleucine patch superfamily enzyme
MLKSLLSRALRRLLRPRIVYGLRRHDGRWLPHTRVSTASDLGDTAGLDIEDHVYIGHFNLIDASGGLYLGEGTQVTSHVSILTHSSHRAVRLMGRRYWGHPAPVGMVRASTHIGPYCFIGAHSVVMPGSRLGRGVLVRAHSYVDGEFPDYAVIAGQPARVVGDVRELDADWLARHPELAAHYAGDGSGLGHPRGGGGQA